MVSGLTFLLQRQSFPQCYKVSTFPVYASHSTKPAEGRLTFLWLAFIIIAATAAAFAYVTGVAGIGVGIALDIAITMTY